jgi:sortase A
VSDSVRPPRAQARRRRWRLAEGVLLIVAVLGLGYYAWVSLEAALYQAYENRQLDEILASAPAPAPRSGVTPVRRRIVAEGTAIGRIEITRLGISAVVRHGSDARTLQLAVGHIPGTSLPGEAGNIGLAAHRDTFFRRLRDIEPDDRIRLLTADGSYTYRVERMDIVEPADVWILEPTSEPTLTLVTCYPFTYIGSAPERFVVRARLETPSDAR